MKPTFQPPRITFWILWGAMLFAVIVYYMVLQLTGVEPMDSDSGAAPAGVAAFRSTLLTLALILLVPSFGLLFQPPTFLSSDSKAC